MCIKTNTFVSSTQNCDLLPSQLTGAMQSEIKIPHIIEQILQLGITHIQYILYDMIQGFETVYRLHKHQVHWIKARQILNHLTNSKQLMTSSYQSFAKSMQ